MHLGRSSGLGPPIYMQSCLYFCLAVGRSLDLACYPGAVFMAQDWSKREILPQSNVFCDGDVQSPKTSHPPDVLNKAHCFAPVGERL